MYYWSKVLQGCKNCEIVPSIGGSGYFHICVERERERERGFGCNSKSIGPPRGERRKDSVTDEAGQAIRYSSLSHYWNSYHAARNVSSSISLTIKPRGLWLFRKMVFLNNGSHLNGSCFWFVSSAIWMWHVLPNECAACQSYSNCTF